MPVQYQGWAWLFISECQNPSSRADCIYVILSSPPLLYIHCQGHKYRNLKRLIESTFAREYMASFISFREEYPATVQVSAGIN